MTEDSPAAIAAESLGHDMLQAILGVVRQFPGWDGLLANQQQVHIERLAHVVKQAVHGGLRVIFKGSYPACVAEIGNVTFARKLITARIQVEKTAEHRHSLGDASGQRVVVVLADPDQYFERMAEVKAQADQLPLFHDPDQPLGHMGVAHPPNGPDTPPEPGSGELFEGGAGGEHGLDDVLDPVQAYEEPRHLVTWQALLEKLKPFNFDIPEQAAATFDEAQLQEAWVYAIACEMTPERVYIPDPPELLRPFCSWYPRPDVPPAAGVAERTDGAAGDASHVETSPPAEPRTTEDDIAVLVRQINARGSAVTEKTVKRWNKTQRIAAHAWLSGLTQSRPDFIPAPKDVPAEGHGEAA